MTAIDFVTITYRPEVLLLKLQARSMARFLDANDVGEIVVIVQGDAPADTIVAIAEEVLPEYGALRSRVRIVTQAELMGIRQAATGWVQQQVLKLAISRTLSAEHYVALDAKNHFINPANALNFVGTDGKALTYRIKGHGSLSRALDNAAKYFNVDLTSPETRLMPTTTPYTLVRAKVEAMIDEVERREGVAFADWFMAPRRYVTEFFLYFAYISATEPGVDALYRFGGRNTVTLFTRWPETEEALNAALAKLADPKMIIFGLHKNRIAQLDEASEAKVTQRWLDAGLFPSAAVASDYLARLREAVKRAPATDDASTLP